MKATFTPSIEPAKPVGITRDEVIRQYGIFKATQRNYAGPEYIIALGCSKICLYIREDGTPSMFDVTSDESYSECRFVPVSGTITLVSDTK